MKGILFTEPMFNAAIKEIKTKTRRIMNPQPKLVFQSEKEFLEEINIRPSELRDSFKPRYKVGETVYLKEPYIKLPNGVVLFKHEERDKIIVGDKYKWINKLFMPAKYARYFIEITSVRCERLQDISDEDCLKEGCYDGKFGKTFDGINHYNYSQQAYAALINKIHGKGTWESNPYVWVYDFKLVNNDLKRV